MMRRTITYLYLGLALGLGLALAGAFCVGLGKVLAAGSSPGATFSVTNTNDSGTGSLREAIADANANPGADLISIDTSGMVLLLSPLPVITDSVIIQGPGADLFAVDGNNNFRVLDIDGVHVTLADLTVQHGSVIGTGEYGAGIRSTGRLSLNRVDILSNTVQTYGGGLHATGVLTITEGSFQNNHSTNSIGGGLRSSGHTVISGTHFLSNTSQGDGGGAFVLTELTITNALFQDNLCTAPSCDGGGLFGFSHTDIQSTQFISNTAQDTGGAVAAPGFLTIGGSQFQNNQSSFGGGGGVFAQNMVTIWDTQFLSNTARGSGGGIYAFAAADLTNVLLQNNQSTIGTGGGLYVNGSVNITSTQFIRNTALEGGGLSHDQGSATLVNTLFAENIATSTSGMAMLLASLEPADVLHATIAGPVPASGSAIEITAGSAAITNTIITHHVVGINNASSNVQQDFNLFFENGADTQGGVSGGANSLTGDPMFVDIAGDDYHLSPGSAAIDMGTDAGVATDFEGDARPANLGFDIGFDEAILPSYFIYLPVISR